MVKARLPVAQIACVAIQSGARVMVNVGRLKKAGQGYSHTLALLYQRYGAGVEKQSVEVTAKRLFEDQSGDYVCSFFHGCIEQQVVVPLSCITQANKPDVRRRVAPTLHHIRPHSFSAAAGGRAGA